MSRLIDQLPDKASLLLMYLAGELPAEDRAAVEREVGRNEALRGELDQLRAAQTAFEAGLARLDAGSPAAFDEAAAVRNASRAIRQWQARPRPVPAPTTRPGVRVAGVYVSWRIVGAAAAAAVVLFAALLVPRGRGNHPRQMVQRPQVVPGAEPEDVVVDLQMDAAYSLRGGFGRTAEWTGEPEQIARADDVGQPNPLAATDGPIFDVPLEPPLEQGP